MSFGIFNPEYVKQLKTKMKLNKQISEIDNMAITAILSTQILYDLFIKRSMPKLLESEIVALDKTVLN